MASSSVARMPAGDLCSPAAAARRRQSPILDRWATPTREIIITSIERQSHEAELSALSNVRASSLIRMWREMESEKERKMSIKMSSWGSSSSEESELSPATFPTAGKVVRVRGRKEMEGLVRRMKEERLREINELAEEQKVSRFPFRGRIQPLIRLRSLQQEVATIKQQQRSIKLEAEELQRGTNSTFLREIAEDISQHNVNEIETEEHTTDFQDSDFGDSVNHSEIEDTQYTELVSTIEFESSPQAFFTSLSKAEDLQESQISDASWNERNLWENSNDLKQPEDSSILKSYQGETLMEETKVSKQTFADNVEILELLERKIVSNFLASDFSHKMNQLIMSFIQKQALQYVNEKGRDESEEETIWIQNYEDCSDQDPSASFNQNSSASEQDEDVMNDLRDGLQIQSELSELRKLVESCLKWQKKIECCIKQEFSSAVNQLVGRGNPSLNTKWKHTCCICCEAQVDTVLYRCGHMCACFKCSQGFQWSSGNCPICRSTIIDVVRIYPNI